MTNLYSLLEFSKTTIQSQNLGLPFMLGEDDTIHIVFTDTQKQNETKKLQKTLV